MPSVLDYTPIDIELVVVDNASTDDSIEQLQAISSRIRVIRLSQNFGFAGGYNEALGQIKANIYILLNSDIEVSPNWTQVLIDYLSEHKDAGIVVPKIRSHLQPSLFEYAGASGGYLDGNGYAYCRGRIFDEIEEDTGQYDDEVNIAWASGCSLAIRASLFHSIGGFDHLFFAHYEEIDMCWRVRRAGYRIVCLPQSTIFHLGGGTMKYASTSKLYLNFRNSLFMLYKNLNGWQRINKIMARLLLDGLSGLVFLCEGKFSYMGAIIRAHLSFYSSLNKLKIRKKRELAFIANSSIGKARHDGQSKKSILWHFFIRKNKKWHELHK